MGYDESLYLSIKDCLKTIPYISERKMFESVAFMYKGYMFCGSTDSKLMIRVGKARHAEFLKVPHVTKMDFTGRSLKGYIYIAPDGLKTQSDVCKWIKKGLSFVKNLPAKSTELPAGNMLLIGREEFLTQGINCTTDV